jgi:hypothetical protein
MPLHPCPAKGAGRSGADSGVGGERPDLRAVRWLDCHGHAHCRLPQPTSGAAGTGGLLQKRRDTGNLSDADLYAAIARRHPARSSSSVFRRHGLEARWPGLRRARRGVADPGGRHPSRARPFGSIPTACPPSRGAHRCNDGHRDDGGGYAAVDPATGDRFGEGRRGIGRGTVWMRPPGATYGVGDRLLRAARATGRGDTLDRALETALAVARAQSCNGGWVPAAELRGDCPAGDPADGGESFDEGLQAGAIGFMLDVAAAIPGGPEQEELLAASRKGLAFVLATQNADGAWPRIPAAASGYQALSTLNDDVTPSHIRILLRASADFGDPAYDAAARRGLDFLVAAQLESGGWAQQYDTDLAPRSARSFEPVAASSIESAYAIAALLDGTRGLGMRLSRVCKRGARYRPLADRSRSLVRHEIGTNRPIFGDRDGSVHYVLNEISGAAGLRGLGRFPDVIAAIRLARAAGSGAEAYAGKSGNPRANRLAQLRTASKPGSVARAGSGRDAAPRGRDRWWRWTNCSPPSSRRDRASRSALRISPARASDRRYPAGAGAVEVGDEAAGDDADQEEAEVRVLVEQLAHPLGRDLEQRAVLEADRGRGADVFDRKDADLAEQAVLADLDAEFRTRSARGCSIASAGSPLWKRTCPGRTASMRQQPVDRHRRPGAAWLARAAVTASVPIRHALTAGKDGRTSTT